MNYPRDLEREARKQGWSTGRTKKGHIRWCSPEGKTCFSPGTPSDYRAIKNTLAELKRLGFEPNLTR